MAASQVGTETTTTWDFTQALSLVSSLWAPANTPPGSQTTNEKATTDAKAVATTKACTGTEQPAKLSAPVSALSSTFDKFQTLGDFQNVFQYLGTGHSELTRDDSPFERFATKLDYASDGATYIGVKKAVKARVSWADGTDIDDSNIATDRSASPPPTPLSKKARWRRNQRIKKGLSKDQQMLVSDSEADGILRKTPARKASVHLMRSGSLPLTQVAGRMSTPDMSDRPRSPGFLAKSDISRDPAAKHGDQKPLSPILDEDTPLTPHVTVARSEAGTQQQITPLNSLRDCQTLPVLPISSLRFTPSSVQPKPIKGPLVDGLPVSSPTQSSLRSTPRPKYSIEPKILRSGIDRNWALLLKVIDEFPQDREYLVSPMNMTNHNNHPNGIHVFVDASNIFIGFLEQLKRSRGIPSTYYMSTKIQPSFDALALLIERRRPVAKRVLVGSTPDVPAFQKARAVGYEVSILEKVLKARELTERQKFFRDREAGLIGRYVKPPPHGKRQENQGYVSGSDTPTPRYAKEAYVEQGVDEILHLKILESLVDYAAPSTIVLATGDAAKAEYSDGFLAMVERALNKGWTVELYSWSQNISSMYKSTKFMKQWEQRFKITYLDAFAEELLDM